MFLTTLTCISICWDEVIIIIIITNNFLSKFICTITFQESCTFIFQEVGGVQNLTAKNKMLLLTIMCYGIRKGIMTQKLIMVTFFSY